MTSKPGIVFIRTTLTLNDDLAAELNRTARLSGQSFNEVVNRAIRQGLSARKHPHAAEDQAFVVQAQSCGFIPGIYSLRLNQLVDQLDLEQCTTVQGSEGRTPS
jgi:predicted transcriptional regulator